MKTEEAGCTWCDVRADSSCLCHCVMFRWCQSSTVWGRKSWEMKSNISIHLKTWSVSQQRRLLSQTTHYSHESRVSESLSQRVWETSEWSFKIVDSASLLLTEWSVKVLKVSSVTSEAESETLKLPRRLLNSSCLFGGSRWHVTPCRGQQRHHGLFHSCVL